MSRIITLSIELDDIENEWIVNGQRKIYTDVPAYVRWKKEKDMETPLDVSVSRNPDKITGGLCPDRDKSCLSIIIYHHPGSCPFSRTQTNMANDELEEINGIKPKVWLHDGEEREVSSQSRYFFYSLV